MFYNFTILLLPGKKQQQKQTTVCPGPEPYDLDVNTCEDFCCRQWNGKQNPELGFPPTTPPKKHIKKNKSLDSESRNQPKSSSNWCFFGTFGDQNGTTKAGKLKDHTTVNHKQNIKQYSVSKVWCHCLS